LFHEGGEVPHAAVEGLHVGVQAGLVVVFAEGLDLELDGIDVGGAGEFPEFGEDLVRGGELGGSWWDLELQMEVVGEDGEGEDLDLTELLVFAQEGEELLLFSGAEDALSVYDSGDAMETAYGLWANLRAKPPHGGMRVGLEGWRSTVFEQKVWKSIRVCWGEGYE
jgi:hypothetical protein